MAGGHDITVAFSEAQIRRAAMMLGDSAKGLKTAMPRALNKTGTWARARLVRRVTGSTGLKSSDVRGRIRFTRATRSAWEVRLRLSDRNFPLLAFRARQTRRGVSFTISKEQGRRTLRGAFIAAMPSGHRGVFRRRTGRRLPIDERMGPALSTIYVNTAGLARMFDRSVSGRLAMELDRQVDVILLRADRRRSA